MFMGSAAPLGDPTPRALLHRNVRQSESIWVQTPQHQEQNGCCCQAQWKSGQQHAARCTRPASTQRKVVLAERAVTCEATNAVRDMPIEQTGATETE